MKKIDAIIGNPPYSTKSNNGKNEKMLPLSDDIAVACFESLGVNGILSLIIPPAYQRVEMKSKLKQLLIDNDFLFDKFYKTTETKKIFGPAVDTSFFILRKSKTKGLKTKVVDFSGENEINFNGYIVHPVNESTLDKIIANDEDEKVEIYYNSSLYDTRKCSKEKGDKFKYPILNNVLKDGSKVFYYANNNDGIEIGKSKLMIADGGGGGIYLDETGEYGQTQFIRSIISDDIEYLKNVEKALKHPKFIEISKLNLKKHSTVYNESFLKLLKKDFWKEFDEKN